MVRGSDLQDQAKEVLENDETQLHRDPDPTKRYAEENIDRSDSELYDMMHPRLPFMYLNIK